MLGTHWGGLGRGFGPEKIEIEIYRSQIKNLLFISLFMYKFYNKHFFLIKFLYYVIVKFIGEQKL